MHAEGTNRGVRAAFGARARRYAVRGNAGSGKANASRAEVALAAPQQRHAAVFRRQSARRRAGARRRPARRRRRPASASPRAATTRRRGRARRRGRRRGWPARPGGPPGRRDRRAATASTACGRTRPAILRLPMPRRTRSAPEAPSRRPAVQDQRPLAVVGEVVPVAQLAQLVDGAPELGQVVAHLVGDAGVGEGDRQAVGVVDRPGQRDGLAAGGQSLVVVAEQPVGVRGKGRRRARRGGCRSSARLAPPASFAASSR